MKVSATRLPEVLLLEPEVRADRRGFFLERYRLSELSDKVGRPVSFVQGNHSKSAQGVLRGLHYQLQRPQDKLVRCIAGQVTDVVVDIRRASPSFGHWISVELSAANHRQLFIPAGFAHGFYTLSQSAETLYEVSEYWSSEHERVIRWNDPDLAIVWPFTGLPQLSQRDANAPLLADAEVFD